MTEQQHEREPGDVTGEETEPEPFVHPEGDDEVAGIPGQIVYEDPDVDAERAGEYAAGKVDTLEDPDAEEEDDEAREQRRLTQTPQEQRMEDQHRAEANQRRQDQEGQA